MNDIVRLELNFSTDTARAYLKIGERFGFSDLRSAVEFFIRTGFENSISAVLSAIFALEDYVRPIVIARESLGYNGYHLDTDDLLKNLAEYMTNPSPECRVAVFQELKRLERKLKNDISEDDDVLLDRAQVMLDAIVALRKAISRTR